MSGALEGVRVVDFGQYIAGPLAAVMLAEQGADVVHVDPPGGPHWNVPADAFLNRSKRRITLNLKSQHDLATAQQLVERADVVIENFRPGVMDRLHLGPHVATDSNNRLIYCSIPGFAHDDPRAGMPAWEGIIAAATGNCRPRAGEAPPDWDSSRPTYSAIPLASNFAAFLAATSVVMALIARHKTGAGQCIEVPLFHAMFTAIGPAGAYITERGLGEPRPIDVNGSGTYRCGDGRYIQFDPSNHRFLIWFAEAAGISHWGPDLLDSERLKDPRNNARLHERLAELFLTRSSFAWETLANAAGAVLAAVRSTSEWLENDHARILGAVTQLEDPILGPTRMAGLPVQLLGSPGAIRHPRHLPDADRADILRDTAALSNSANHPEGKGSAAPAAALAGVRVLDLTQVLAGPTSGRLLAEFGADVIKINGPQRRIGSHGYLNRGKRSILLDVESPAGQQAFWKLVERADVVIQNFPKGTPERYGIGYEQLRTRKPDIIYTSLSCYGYGGPWGAGRGYERQAQAVAGVMDRVGIVPAILGPYNLVDIGTGVLTTFATSLALIHKARTGQGQHVQTSLCQTATYHQTIYALDYAGAVHDEPRGWEALGSGPLRRFYQASDGWFFFFAARESESSRLEQLVASKDLEKAFGQRPVAHWVDCLRQAGISAHAVVNLPDLMRDPWVREHGLSISQTSAEVGDVTYPGVSVKLSATPMRIGPATRRPGGDADDVFSEIDSAGMIPALERAWALQIADAPPGW